MLRFQGQTSKPTQPDSLHQVFYLNFVYSIYFTGYTYKHVISVSGKLHEMNHHAHSHVRNAVSSRFSRRSKGVKAFFSFNASFCSNRHSFARFDRLNGCFSDEERLRVVSETWQERITGRRILATTLRARILRFQAISSRCVAQNDSAPSFRLPRERIRSPVSNRALIAFVLTLMEFKTVFPSASRVARARFLKGPPPLSFGSNRVSCTVAVRFRCVLL